MPIVARIRVLSFLALLTWSAFVCQPAMAQTWTGGGANNNWSSGANWSTGTAPTTGNLTFTGENRLSINNDMGLDAVRNAGFIFDANAGSFTISGPRMQITLINNLSTNIQRIAAPFFLGSSQVTSVPISVVAGGTVVLSNSLTSPGTAPTTISGFTKSGEGVLQLTGQNVFFGRSIINQGTVQVATLANANSISSLGGGNGGSVIRIGASGSTATLEYQGSANSTTNRQIAIGSGNGDGGAKILNNGTGRVVFSNATFNALDTAGSTTNNRTLTLGGSNTALNTIQGVIQNNSSGSTLKTISIAKEDFGTWVLSAANTYTGTTTVTAGTLMINGNQSAATGAVTIASGATLGGTGTIGGATNFMLGAIHSPGTSPGLQTFANDLTYATGSQLNWELTTSTDAGRGTSFDGIDTSGVVTISSGVTSNLLFNSPGSNVLWSDSFWDTDHGWLVYSNANAPLTSGSIFDSLLVSNDSGGNALLASRGSFAWNLSGNNIMLSYTATITALPEPSSLLLLSAAGLGGWISRRKARRSVIRRACVGSDLISSPKPSCSRGDAG